MLISSAPATPIAQRLASDEAVEVVDRGRLQQWILEARDEIEQRGSSDTDGFICSPGGMGLAGQVLTVVLCSTLITLILTTFPLTLPKAMKQPSPPAASSTSETVVKDFFAAINRHDWPVVW
jgi:hypothetical protein